MASRSGTRGQRGSSAKARRSASEITSATRFTHQELPLGFEPQLPWLHEELRSFREFGTETLCQTLQVPYRGLPIQVPLYVNEFWTSKQRAAHSLHEISYRACFKPQLPRFFIERLSAPGAVIFDPYMGRGTTPLEAALLGRIGCGNDANPLSKALIQGRINPPTVPEFTKRLAQINLSHAKDIREDLDVFYHKNTLRELCALREYFLQKEASGTLDAVDAYLLLLAINRLTGHSPGFFSVYTLPPNQAVSIQRQKIINEKREQVPEYRDVKKILLKKATNLLSDLTDAQRTAMRAVAEQCRFTVNLAENMKDTKNASVDLVITSPPFLNVVQYETDNWLRCWFLGLDAKSLGLTTPAKLESWRDDMHKTLRELLRICKPGAHVAFEVGEVQQGSLKLEEIILPEALAVGFLVELVLINAQEFTKTANCWGVNNQQAGTNTNRVVLMRKP